MKISNSVVEALNREIDTAKAAAARLPQGTFERQRADELVAQYERQKELYQAQEDPPEHVMAQRDPANAFVAHEVRYAVPEKPQTLHLPKKEKAA